MQNSKFDASVWEYWIHSLIALLAATLTVGLATPWITTWFETWRLRHTIVNGKRLKFTGSGTVLFSRYIIWWALTIITLGLYVFWMRYNLIKWVAEHTEFADEI